MPSVLVLLAGCAPVSDCRVFDEICTTQLQAMLEQGVEDLDLIGAAMGLADAEQDQLWAGAAGLADTASSQAWTPGRAFYVGSVTKTFTTALVLQLQDEGLLGLEDPVEDWVPGYYDGVGLTLRHLLSHTSGIVSYNYVGSFDDSLPWTPQELVGWAVAHEPALRFSPGSAWEYSNTNFVLLGLVVEAATGRSYEDQVAARLTEPLGLADTYVALSGNQDEALVSCYDVDGVDITGSMDPSMGWAAGAIVSTPADLARWGAALYGGDLVSDAMLTEMTTQVVLTDGTVVEHGLGTFVETDGVDTLVGHSGGFQGYQTYLYYWQADPLALAVMSNQQGADLRTLAAYGWSLPLGLDFP